MSTARQGWLQAALGAARGAGAGALRLRALQRSNLPASEELDALPGFLTNLPAEMRAGSKAKD